MVISVNLYLHLFYVCLIADVDMLRVRPPKVQQLVYVCSSELTNTYTHDMVAPIIYVSVLLDLM